MLKPIIVLVVLAIGCFCSWLLWGEDGSRAAAIPALLAVAIGFGMGLSENDNYPLPYWMKAPFILLYKAIIWLRERYRQWRNEERADYA